MNNNVKNGLIFGSFMSVVFLFEDMIELDSYTTKEVLKAIISSLVGGVIAGSMFGWLNGKFKINKNSSYLNQATKIELEPNEQIVFDSGANHFKGLEAVGGKLYLTNKRLVFKSHSLNIQNHLWSINLSDILVTQPCKTWLFINNGLIITTSKPSKDQFVVDKNIEWIKLLQNQRYKSNSICNN